MNESLQQFAQQLASWAEEIIDGGRTPFRRVETCPIIETEQGPIEIPLIFWINRQSLMAGGLILIPEDDHILELENGRCAAKALGLNHFVTWEKNQVRIWECQPKEICAQQCFPLKDPNYLETFRFVLEDLLEALKLTAVLGAVPPAELCPDYFHNLIQITLQQSQPSLTESYRSYRSGEDQSSSTDIDQCAREENRLALLRILALLWRGEIPLSIMPENLEETLQTATRQLPEGIAKVFTYSTLEDPPQLPIEAAVAFHHILLRLRQLSWDQTETRIKKTLLALSQSWFPAPASTVTDFPISLYPESPPLNDSQLVLSDSPSLLALTALLQCGTSKNYPELVFNNLFKLNREGISQAALKVRLLNTRPLLARERNEILTQLRYSWPHRRFKVKTGQPLWYWEMIHLLGFCRPEQKINMDVPLQVLQTPVDGIIWTLLADHFSLEEIHRIDRTLNIRMIRRRQAHDKIRIFTEEETRSVDYEESRQELRNALLLALLLPQKLFSLIGQELIWPTQDHEQRNNHEGLSIYRQSLCYKLFVAQTEVFKIEDTENLESNPGDERLPLPDPISLDQLVTEKRLHPDLSNDQLLAKVISCPALATLELPKNKAKSRHYDRQLPSQKESKQHLLQQAESFGIPKFPEQYLYFLEQPELQKFSISPPLTEESNILGEFVFVDSEGQKIKGFGEELHQALTFCSQADKESFELPRDREQINLMLQHYRKDLRALYEHIGNISYSQYEKAKEARKIVNKAWKKLRLPSPAWFKN